MYIGNIYIYMCTFFRYYAANGLYPNHTDPKIIISIITVPFRRVMALTRAKSSSGETVTFSVEKVSPDMGGSAPSEQPGDSAVQ